MPPRKSLTTRQRWHLSVYQNHKCARCYAPLDDTSDSDHIIPLCAGGGNTFDNYQLLCLPCHRRKSLHEQRVLAAQKRGDSSFVCPRCRITVCVTDAHVCALSRKAMTPKRYTGTQRCIHEYFRQPTLLEKLDLLRYKPQT